MQPRRTTFSAIKHLLPADCWAVWRNAYRPGEFDQEPVLVYDQPTELISLQLDFEAGGATPLLLLLVRGSLTVRDFIYNEETDGATGLVVLGDLRTRTMLVGGQEIYVTGSLTVDEVFWGDYNHGSLRVLGDAQMAVLAALDYDVNVQGITTCYHHLTPEHADTNWQVLNLLLVRALFTPEIIRAELTIVDDETGEEEEEIQLKRDAATLRRLQAGQSLLRQPLGGSSHNARPE